MNALSDKMSLQLKLLPEEGYMSIIAKVVELLQMYQNAETKESLTHINQSTTTNDDRLNKLEKAVLQVIQQLMA